MRWSPRQRIRKWFATSATAGPRIRTAASCQPTLPWARCRGVSIRVAAVEGEVDPADEGDAVVDDDRLLVVRVECADARVRLALDGRLGAELLAHQPDVRTRGPEEADGRTTPEENADIDARRHSARRLRTITGSSPRVSCRCGDRYQPEMWTCDSARASSSAIAGSAAAPSIRTSRSFPGRGGRRLRPSTRRRSRRARAPTRPSGDDGDGESRRPARCRSRQHARLPETPPWSCRPKVRPRSLPLPRPCPDPTSAGASRGVDR